MKQYRIVAELDRAEGVEGYSIHDYFALDLNETYPSMELAWAAAEAGYRGTDCDGVGCHWWVASTDGTEAFGRGTRKPEVAA